MIPTLFQPIVRLWRFARGGCLVCGAPLGSVIFGPLYVFGGQGWRKTRYCSLECGAYDGALTFQPTCRLLFGHTERRRRKENFL